jgi:hypothetical protein
MTTPQTFLPAARPNPCNRHDCNNPRWITRVGSTLDHCVRHLDSYDLDVAMECIVQYVLFGNVVNALFDEASF